MKLGQKASTFYGSPSTEKDPMIYPEVSLPTALFDKAYKIGDKCVIELTGTIESMSKESYRIKLTEGIESESPATEKKEDSILKKAK